MQRPAICEAGGQRDIVPFNLSVLVLLCYGARPVTELSTFCVSCHGQTSIPMAGFLVLIKHRARKVHHHIRLPWRLPRQILIHQVTNGTRRDF